MLAQEVQIRPQAQNLSALMPNDGLRQCARANLKGLGRKAIVPWPPGSIIADEISVCVLYGEEHRSPVGIS
jgi:hypothetical protein